MSIGLADLGREMHHEFDERESELTSLRLDTLQTLKFDKNEQVKNGRINDSEMRDAKAELRNAIVNLQTQHRQEQKTVLYGLREDISDLAHELQEWVKEELQDCRSWCGEVYFILNRHQGR